MAVKLSFMTLNVRGIRDRLKRVNIFEWCKTKKNSIIFLQESYSTVEIEERWKQDWGGPMFFSHGSNHSRGVLVLFSNHLDFEEKTIKVDEEGRYIIFKGEIQRVKMLLGNVHFPTRDKETLQIEFLKKLDESIFDQYDRDYLV